MRTVGIYYAYWTHEWDVDFIPFVRKVKKLGYDQLEINGGTIAALSANRRQLLVKEASDYGIVLSYGVGLTKDHDVSSPDESVRLSGVAFMKKTINTVGSMGGGTMCGTIHSCWPTQLPKGQDKRLYFAQSIKSMRELVKVAENNNVILCVEVINRFEQFMLNTCAEALEYVNTIDHPHCKILLDTFHMNIEEDSLGDAIRLAGPYLHELHVGETNRKPAGMGRLPWNEIRTALDDIDYDGAIVQEPFILPGGQVGQDIAVWREIIHNPDLDALAAESARFVRRALCE